MRIHPSVKSRALVYPPPGPARGRGPVPPNGLLHRVWLYWAFTTLYCLERRSELDLVIVPKTCQGLWQLIHILLMRLVGAPYICSIWKRGSRNTDEPAGVLPWEATRSNPGQGGNWGQKHKDQSTCWLNGARLTWNSNEAVRVSGQERSGGGKQELRHTAGDIRQFKQNLKIWGVCVCVCVCV